MEITNLIPHIEALIFASDKPLTSLELTELVNNAFGFMEDKITLDQVEAAIEGITEKYGSEFYPFEMRQSGGGWQFLTKRDFHKTVAQLNGEKFLKRLSSAALETLSIIAYKQPVTKAEIESIRGVQTSAGTLDVLMEAGWVRTAGRREAPGRPRLGRGLRQDLSGLRWPPTLRPLVLLRAHRAAGAALHRLGPPARAHRPGVVRRWPGPGRTRP